MRTKVASRIFVLAALLLFIGTPALADSFQLSGVIAPSACRVGGVLSTDQFTSTGFSNVRTANPNDEIVAGAWVIANDFVPDTSIVQPPNCEPGSVGEVSDQQGLNLMGVRLKPTTASAGEADIQEIKLVWDVNANGLWDPLLDLVLQVQPGNLLDTQDGAVFSYGPQAPLAFLVNTADAANPCQVGATDGGALNAGLGPTAGTNTRTSAGTDGCYIALLAIAVIGDNPTTGSQFGLELHAHAGDIPGTTGIESFSFSSGFSSSRNPQGSNVRLTMVGGTPSSHTPLEHISNASGAPESAVNALAFTGGEQGEGLLSRFRALELIPGSREAIAMAVGLCDGGYLANTNAAVLPAIAGAPPTIAGGLSSLPCIGSAGTDGFATGINGATLVFRGPLARYMGTVRMYADECSSAGGPTGADVCDAIGNPQAPIAAPITATDSGGGDGFLFQAGELVEQVVPQFNEETGESIAQFGARQEQVLYTGNGNVVAHGSDPAGAPGGPFPGGLAINPGTTPLILIWTVDIDSNAPGGQVDVMLGLQSFDDTAINAASGGTNPCVVFAGSAPAVPTAPNQVGAAVAGSCASNFSNTGPATYSFTVEGPEHPSTPNNLASFDTNDSCFFDDPEFFSMIDGWVDAQIGDSLFFDGVDAWVSQTNICNNGSGSSSTTTDAMRLDDVELQRAFDAMTISVEGAGIAKTGIEIYSLTGDLIFSDDASGQQLVWNMTTSEGAPVANGTYLYVVTTESADGESLSSEVRKLIVLR